MSKAQLSRDDVPTPAELESMDVDELEELIAQLPFGDDVLERGTDRPKPRYRGILKKYRAGGTVMKHDSNTKHPDGAYVWVTMSDSDYPQCPGCRSSLSKSQNKIDV